MNASIACNLFKALHVFLSPVHCDKMTKDYFLDTWATISSLSEALIAGNEQLWRGLGVKLSCLLREHEWSRLADGINEYMDEWIADPSPEETFAVEVPGIPEDVDFASAPR